MAASASRQVVRVLFRRFNTSSPRFVRFRFSAPSPIKEIGKFLPVCGDTPYQPGQIFIHRIFAYKGIVVCSFNCRVHEKKPDKGDVVDSSREQSFYQVLIHRQDWPHMGFPVDMTAYLGESSTANRQERHLTNITGMDCVPHDDLLPLDSSEQMPIDHDLFPRIFLPNSDNIASGIRFAMRPDLVQNYKASERSWLAPRDVYVETSENIEVRVMTFYLGANMVGGQQKHCWRYVVRLENLDPARPAILRERNLKVFSLNNMHQVTGHGVVGTQPELNVARPAFQFSSTVELQQPKGGHMWGKFKMERENGQFIVVNIPTVVLESFPEEKVETTAKTE